MTVMRSTFSGMSWMPSQVPLPMISRMEAINTMVRMYPTPIPRPSSVESSTVFLQANISARPRMMQLTTISAR